MLRIHSLIMLLLMTTAMTAAPAADFAVVVASGSSIQNMAPERIRDMFLKRRNFEGDIKLVPVNPLGEDQLRRQFEQAVLQMNRDDVNRYWTTSHFQGVKPPITQASLESVKRFVARVDGAIGYIPRSMVDSSMRVLYEF